MIRYAVLCAMRLGAYILVGSIGLVLVSNALGVDEAVRLGGLVMVIGSAIEILALLPMTWQDIRNKTEEAKDA